MKSHKYWSIGALITMLGTFIQVIRDQKKAISTLQQVLCFA
jgi:hypothetical protein